MYSTLFSIGPFTVHSFGLMVALGFLLCSYLMPKFLERGLSKSLLVEETSQLLVYAIVGGALGARFAYVAEHWSLEFADKPFWEVLRFDKGGLMFYGGLGGAILAILLFCVPKHRKILDTFDLCAAVLPVGHAFGRIGCFLNGCCFGRVTESFLGVTYPAKSPVWNEQLLSGQISRVAMRSLPVMPSQLIEAACNFILFGIIFYLTRKERCAGFVTGVYLVGYGCIRFLTEMLRSDPRMNVGIFSIGQFISIVVVLAGILFLSVKVAKNDRG